MNEWMNLPPFNWSVEELGIAAGQAALVSYGQASGYQVCAEIVDMPSRGKRKRLGLQITFLQVGMPPEPFTATVELTDKNMQLGSDLRAELVVAAMRAVHEEMVVSAKERRREIERIRRRVPMD